MKLNYFIEWFHLFNEIIEQISLNKFIEICWSEMGTKGMSLVLGLQWIRVKTIIRKWRKHETVGSLPRVDQPTNITKKAHQQFIQGVIKIKKSTSEALQGSVKVAVFDSTRIWAKMASIGEFKAQSHCTAKQTIQLLNLCQKQNFIPKVKHGSGSPSVMHWGCFAASVPGQCAVNWCNHELCSLWDQWTWAPPSIAKMKVFKWTLENG